MRKDIWVLTDNKTGNNNQAIALAEELGLGYEIKKISYNFLGILPNFLLGTHPVHIKKRVLQSLKIEELPKLIISSGRRTAVLAAYFKKQYASKVIVAQIMRPAINPEFFDYIILPEHDNFNYASPKVIRVIGALGYIQEKLEAGRELLGKHYPEAKNFIAVFLGGSTKSYNFTDKIAVPLLSSLKQIANNHSLSLFVSFSRRTPEEVKKVIRDNLSSPHIIFDPASEMPNPYFGMLAEAKYVIVTADSISMCSEIASTGKPFYIFCPDEFNLKKHRFFIQQLIDLRIAKKLDLKSGYLENYSYEPLCEVKKVAHIIRPALM